MREDMRELRGSEEEMCGSEGECSGEELGKGRGRGRGSGVKGEWRRVKGSDSGSKGE